MRTGQHYNQVGYMARFYGISNLEKKLGRSIKVNIIETKDILKLKNNFLSKEDLKNTLKSLIKPKSVEQIFSGTFLSKKVEIENKINLLEDDFIKNCDKYNLNLVALFNKENPNIFNVTVDYFCLHEARNFENFIFIKKEVDLFLESGLPINEFIENTYFFKDCKIKSKKRFIKDCLLSLKNPTFINNKQLYQGKVKEVFNSLYINAWGKLKLDFHKMNWFIFELEMGVGIGNNLVLNFKNPLYKNYKTIPSYLWLDDRIKKMIDEGIIIFLANDKIALGNFKKINDFPMNLFKENYDNIHRFLMGLCLTHSYRQIIITDDSQLDFMLDAFVLDFPAFLGGIEETNKMFDSVI